MADIVHSGGHAEHEHPPYLQHHFDTPVQQFEAGKLGMWLFLATEVLFFSGLFVAYAVYRRNHPEIFLDAHTALSVFWGATNTVILITSSFTMALGVYCAQKSYRTGLIVCLILTLAGAAGFMAIKAVEYSQKWEHGLLWGKFFDPNGLHPALHDEIGGHAAAPAPSHAPTPGTNHAAAATPAVAAAAHTPPAAADAGHAPPPAPTGPEKTQLLPSGVLPYRPVELPPPDSHEALERAKNLHIFFGIYFAMTGLHGLHVLAGMVVLTWLLVGAVRGRYGASYFTPVDLGGLYWHLVDLVWIYLFPLLYLIK